MNCEPSKLLSNALLVLSLILTTFILAILFILIFDAQMQYLRPRLDVTVITMLFVSLYFLIWNGYRRSISIKYPEKTVKPLSSRDAKVLLILTIILFVTFVISTIIKIINGFIYINWVINIFALAFFAIMIVMQVIRLVVTEPLPESWRKPKAKWTIPFTLLIMYLSLTLSFLFKFIQINESQPYADTLLPFILLFGSLYTFLYDGYWQTTSGQTIKIVSQKYFIIFLTVSIILTACVGAIALWRLIRAMQLVLVNEIEPFILSFCSLVLIQYFFTFWMYFLLPKNSKLTEPESKDK